MQIAVWGSLALVVSFLTMAWGAYGADDPKHILVWKWGRVIFAVLVFLAFVWLVSGASLE